MQKIFLLILGALLGTAMVVSAAPNVLQTFQGGTGTSTPSGILYGDNGATTHVNTVQIGTNLTFSGGVLSATGGSGGSGTVSTSTNETAGSLSYWTSNSATPALLGKVATTTLTATSPLSLSQPISVIGASPSVLTVATTTTSLFVGSAGQVLAFLNGGWVGTATTTFSAPLVFSGGNVTCTSASAGVTGCLTGTDWNTFNNKVGAYDAFTHPASGQSATTSTLILTTGGLVINAASSTVNGNLKITGNATTTNATTTALAVSNLTSGNCVQVSTGGNLVNSPNGACGSASGLASYDAFTHPSANVSATTSGMVINAASSTFSGNLMITGSATTTAFSVANTASTTNLIVSSAGGTAGCATFSTNGTISNTGSNCGGSLTNNQNIIYVAKWGSDANNGLTSNTPKLTLNAATSTATAGSVIYVYPGRYNETIIKLPSKVDLIGADASTTIIYGTVPDLGDSLEHGIIEPQGVSTISNITINDINPVVGVLAIRSGAVVITTNGTDVTYDNVYLYGGWDSISNNTYTLTTGTSTVYNSVLYSDYDAIGWYLPGRLFVFNTKFYVNGKSGSDVAAIKSNGPLYIENSYIDVTRSNSRADAIGIQLVGTQGTSSDVYITAYATSTVNTIGYSVNSSSPLKVIGGHVDTYGGATNIDLSNLSGSITIKGATDYKTTSGTISHIASSTNLVVSSAGGVAGCATFSANGTISNTGSACGSGSGITAYDAFSHLVNFGATNSATTSPLWAQGGLNASSTSHFTNLDYSGTFGIATSSNNASSTLFTVNGEIFMTASSTGLNTSLGLSALGSNISGRRNTVMGYQALQLATSSWYSTAVGYKTLQNAIGRGDSAAANSAFGYLALNALTGGTANTGLGSQALANLTTGTNNVTVGGDAGNQIITGNQNTIVGAAAFDITEGSFNVAVGGSALGGAGNTLTGNTGIGWQAGNLMLSGQYNTLLGYNSNSTNLDTGSNNILIGANTGASAIHNLSSGSNNISIGHNISFPSATADGQFDIANLVYATSINNAFGNTISTSTIGISTSSPFAKFSIQAPDKSTRTTLFAIGSSTATATSTLFRVSNTGIASTTGLVVSNAGGVAGCAQFTADGTVTNTGTACGSASGLAAYNAFTNPTATTFATTSGMVINNASSTFVGGVAVGGIINGYQQLQFSGPTFGQVQDLTAGASLEIKTALGVGDVLLSPSATTTGWFKSQGNFGYASSTPFSEFSIHAAANNPYKTIFAIGSSTASATSTLFSISNTGIASTTGLVVSNTGGTGSRCLHSAADGTVSAAATDCSTGGSGTVLPGLGSIDDQYQMAYYPANGTTVQGTSSITFSHFNPGTMIYNFNDYTGTTSGAGGVQMQIDGAGVERDVILATYSGNGNSAIMSSNTFNEGFLFQGYTTNILQYQIGPSGDVPDFLSDGHNFVFGSTTGVGSTQRNNAFAKLSVWGVNNTANTRAFEVVNQASTTLFMIDNAANVRISTTTSVAKVAIHARAQETNKQLFNISSSTATATTTHFYVANTGAIFAPNTTNSASAQTGYWCYDANGEFIRVSTTCIVSALKFKTDVQDLPVGLATVLEMKPVTYHLKDPLSPQDKGEQIGFIADWSEKLLPQLVTHDSSGEVHGFNYEQYTAVLTKAIQDFYKEFQALLARVSGLEQKIDTQQKQIDKLQIQVDTLLK